MSNGGSYDPHAVEGEIYRFWEAGDYFHAVPDPQRRPFTIVIPPPNVTGALHMGHALNNTLQDILVRRARMRGRVACWLPGTDHAGIATQAVVEKRLKQEQKLSRHELGRDGLVAKIWEWKEDYNARIINQLRKMGCSCDWQRTRFTLDEVCARAVYETFFRFFRDGLIFRGQRLVNWDAHLQTAVADDEIVHETVKGSLWHIRYPVADRPRPTADAPGVEGVDYLVVATTRPETMLGDTAIAVHPDDDRYRHLIGRSVILPLLERPIPVIADGLLVKREFGTGCVKVTPAHDPNDYACGQRHGLAMINILTPDGHINAAGGAYAGLERYEARKRVVADLEAAGLLAKVEPYETEVGHSDRSKTPIEPMLSEQWFVNMDQLAELAMEAVRDGRVRFFPERYAKSYLDWLGEKRDWCISRQLWWGHRIPVWRRTIELAAGAAATTQAGLDKLPGSAADRVALRVTRVADGAVLADPRAPLDVAGAYDVAVCLRDPQDAALAQPLEAAGFVQDPDVLDTWFSSALWPHSTFGWPGAAEADGRSEALDYFYPTDVLCTARDIISLWVARMVMTGLYNLGRVPFPHVYIHPVIQDGQGRRMSKSAGNGVDPLDIIEMYGTDAMRLTLAQLAGETQDIRLPVKATKLDDGRTVNTSERFEFGRNFCNKLWQAATGCVLGNLDGYAPRALRADDLEVEDRWILSRLSAAIGEVDRRLDRYQFNEVCNTLYQLFWSDYCDWYIELVKPRLFGRAASGALVNRTDASAQTARQVLAWVLDQVLRLLHPVTPFVTEALWKRLNAAAPQRGIGELVRPGDALLVAPWPVADPAWHDAAVERDIDALRDVIRALRDIRNRVNGIRAGAREAVLKTLPRAVIRAGADLATGLTDRTPAILRLGQIDAVEIGPDVTKPPESASQVFPGLEVYVGLAGLADLDTERARLRRERDEAAAYVVRLAAKLSQPGFATKAPPAVVEQERERLATLKDKLAAIERNLAEING